MKVMKPSRFTRRQVLAGMTAGAALAAMGEMTMGQTKPSLITKPIPASKETLPVIGLGTWQTFDVGDGQAERRPLEDVLREFVALGGKLIDSSPMYGRSEDVAGDLAAKLGVHDKLFVATKVWIRGKDAGIKQMNESMTKLRVKTIDLMQVHNLVDTEAHLDTLRGWKKDGRVRYLGITHYTATAHDAVAKVVETTPVDFVQINYSIAEREAEKKLLPLCRDKAVAVIANRPFGGGAAIKRLAGQPVPDWAKEIDATSWAQLLLKFVVSHPAITVAIPATSKVTHLRDNMAACVGRLPDEALRAKITEAATS